MACEDCKKIMKDAEQIILNYNNLSASNVRLQMKVDQLEARLNVKAV